jgi:hypothetical protein
VWNKTKQPSKLEWLNYRDYYLSNSGTTRTVERSLEVKFDDERKQQNELQSERVVLDDREKGCVSVAVEGLHYTSYRFLTWSVALLLRHLHIFL